jgi:meiotic recombination protein REC8
VPGLDLPSDTTGNAGRFALKVGETRVSNRGPGSSNLLPRDGEDSLLPEADFTFDAEGNLIEFTHAVHSIADPSLGAAPARGQRDEQPGVPAEHEGGQLAGSGLPVSLSIMICLSSG